MMTKTLIPILFLCSAIAVYADDIEVSQDTLLQNLNYGATADRTITITNNTSSAVDLSITLVDQTVDTALGPGAISREPGRSRCS
jgi:hypothetical protein